MPEHTVGRIHPAHAAHTQPGPWSHANTNQGSLTRTATDPAFTCTQTPSLECKPQAHAYTLIRAHGDSHPTQTRTLTSTLACRGMCGHAQVCRVPHAQPHSRHSACRPDPLGGGVGALLTLRETLPLQRALGGKSPQAWALEPHSAEQLQRIIPQELLGASGG